MNTGYQIMGPLADPAQAEAMQAFAIKGVVGLGLFFLFLYWWANR